MCLVTLHLQIFICKIPILLLKENWLITITADIPNYIIPGRFALLALATGQHEGYIIIIINIKQCLITFLECSNQILTTIYHVQPYTSIRPVTLNVILNSFTVSCQHPRHRPRQATDVWKNTANVSQLQSLPSTN